MEDLLEGNIQKIEHFKKLGYKVEVLWEWEFHHQLVTNSEMEAFLQNLKFDTPVEPHHAFFGGWTNSVCLQKEVSEGEKIIMLT